MDTHKKIIDQLSEPVRRLADVQVSTKVTRIESTSTQEYDPKVFITGQHNGQEFTSEFDEVIVTIPLGCLKLNAISFIPPLPANIIEAVQGASISSLEKVYISFPKAFWDSPASDVSSTSDSDQTTPDKFPTFANFLSGSSSEDYLRPWSLELNTLSNPDIFGSHAMPVLLFSLFGSAGKTLTSLLDALTPGTEQYYARIVNFFKPYYSLLPNYSIDNPECVPDAVLATEWGNDALAGHGSYTNFKVSSASGREVVLDKEVETMREGLPDRGIWLAGEHTAPFVALGTSTGAYWSGESVAMRILGTHGLVDDESLKN